MKKENISCQLIPGVVSERATYTWAAEKQTQIPPFQGPPN